MLWFVEKEDTRTKMRTTALWNGAGLIAVYREPSQLDLDLEQDN